MSDKVLDRNELRIKLRAKLEANRIARQSFDAAVEAHTAFDQQLREMRKKRRKGDRRLFLQYVVEELGARLREKEVNMDQEMGGEIGGTGGNDGGFHGGD